MFKDKWEFYNDLNSSLEGLISEEQDWLANICNACALLYLMIHDVNWAGFYFKKGEQLVLGPFQGKPACIRIPIGKGVCGIAAQSGEIQVVEDVHKFPGHIACDCASMSEIVIPIIKEGELIGVLDIDSPRKGRFDYEDAKGLSDFVKILNKYINWPST